jgi:pimeloyl-ACP methyl ester carboxylesterase
MQRTEHHAGARDGTRLFWTSAGSGAPALVLTDGIGCAGYVWRHLEPAIAAGRRVIHWNYRGHGRSEAPSDLSRSTVDDCVDDLLAVLDAAGEPSAILAGHSMGVQVAIAAHRRAPERVLALLLLCGAPGRPIDTFHDSPALRLVFPFARAAVERYPAAARALFRVLVPTELALAYALAFEVDGARVERVDLIRYFDDLSQIDPTLFVRMLASAGEHDTSHHLPSVNVPTLVVAGERDSFTPVRLSAAMHAAIPGSDLLVVPGGTHVAPLEHPELVGGRVLAFLDRLEAAPASRREAARAARTAGSRAPSARPGRSRRRSRR